MTDVQVPEQQPAPAAGPIAPRPMSTLAVIGFVAAFLMPIAGLVLSIVAVNRIRLTREDGRGLAVAGIWISAAGTLFLLVFFSIWLSVVVQIVSRFPQFR